jgi:hypothetical protein
MYLRRTHRGRKDGSVVGYVQLAHNRRGGGATRAEVLVNLSREDELDMDGLLRLARSITRYTDGEPLDAAEAAEPRPHHNGPRHRHGSDGHGHALIGCRPSRSGGSPRAVLQVRWPPRRTRTGNMARDRTREAALLPVAIAVAATGGSRGPAGLGFRAQDGPRERACADVSALARWAADSPATS